MHPIFPISLGHLCGQEPCLPSLTSRSLTVSSSGPACSLVTVLAGEGGEGGASRGLIERLSRGGDFRVETETRKGRKEHFPSRFSQELQSPSSHRTSPFQLASASGPNTQGAGVWAISSVRSWCSFLLPLARPTCLRAWLQAKCQYIQPHWGPYSGENCSPSKQLPCPPDPHPTERGAVWTTLNSGACL
uniref:Uncharacterized protein n=1 Tax=Myotis myotis TaxID=51298 RepID=A0A7J7T5P8_MYOMY|nr:hypothetical protein mMyoMyo1_009158 [Myotis myotis]